MTKIHLEVFPTSQGIAPFAAELVAQVVRSAVSERGRCLLSLSGGGTPQPLYRLLAGSPYAENLPWNKVFFFWGDERCVPPTDDESCYKQAYSTWLGKVEVPSENIFRALGELDPQMAAADYAAKLKSLAEPGLDWPRFDLALLGMGTDGHTASLFPGSPETAGLATVAVTANYQDRPARRVSMTPDVFNAARNVVFLAAGSDKARALAATLQGERRPVEIPAQRIRPVSGDVWWLVDELAASQVQAPIAGVDIRRAA